MTRKSVVGAWRAFLSGLTTHSLGSALGAIAVAIIELSLATLLVTPRTLARLDPGYLRENHGDELATGTVRALSLRFSTSDRRGVVLLGSSNTRRALFDGGRSMSEDLSLAAGESIDFHGLAGNRQQMREWFVLLDQIPQRFRGVVVLGVCDQIHLGRMQHAAKRMPLDSPTSDHFRRELGRAGKTQPRKTGVYFLDHLDFFASRRGALARIGPAPGPIVREHRPAGPERWRNARDRLAQQSEPPTLALLERLALIVRRLQARGLEVVLLEAPINPRFDRLKPRSQSRTKVYEPTMRGFARRQGVRFWNPSVAAKLSERDFADEIHLGGTAAQKRFQRALVQRLGALLRAEPVPDGPDTPDPDGSDDDPTDHPAVSAEEPVLDPGGDDELPQMDP